MFNNINFSPGKIVYDDFYIDIKVSLEDQIYSLKEDMFQVNYHDKYLIDIGWHSEFDPRGNFIVRVINDFDWEHPIFLKKTNNLQILNKIVEESAQIVKELLIKNDIFKDK